MVAPMIYGVLGLALLYGLVCLGARRFHRFFVYAPDPTYVRPDETELEGVDEIVLKTPDGFRLIAWSAAPEQGRPTLLYFTGNSGSVAGHADKIAEIRGSGYGVFMLNYRGFGGSEGRPSEAANVADAGLCYEALLKSGVKPQDIVAYGESLGTSVATQLAAKRAVKALVLEAPFTSAVDVGRRNWWFLPLRLLMVDQYRSIDLIGGVHVPLLIVHGARDRVIPVAQAKQLYAAANLPKTLEIFPDADHNDLYEHGAFAAIDRFLRALPGRASKPVETRAGRPGPAKAMR
jgi:uncharacterized protein